MKKLSIIFICSLLLILMTVSVSFATNQTDSASNNVTVTDTDNNVNNVDIKTNDNIKQLNNIEKSNKTVKTANPKSTGISFSKSYKSANQTVDVTAYLKSGGVGIANETLTLTYNNVSKNYITGVDGNITDKFNVVKPGQQVIEVYYAGSDEYKASNRTETFQRLPSNSLILFKLNTTTVHVGDVITISTQLVERDQTPIVNEKLNLTLNNVTYLNKVTDKNGYVNITYNVTKPLTNNFTVVHAENDYYAYQTNYFSFNSNRWGTSDLIWKKYSTENYTIDTRITLYSNEHTVAGEKFRLALNDNETEVITDADGVASVIFKLKDRGDQTLYIWFDETDMYKPHNRSVTISSYKYNTTVTTVVNKTATIGKVLPITAQLNYTATNGNSLKLSNEVVTISINNKNYTGITDNKGQYTVNYTPVTNQTLKIITYYNNGSFKFNISQSSQVSVNVLNNNDGNNVYDNVNLTSWTKTYNNTVIKNSNITNITNFGNLTIINSTIKNINSANILLYNKGNLTLINTTIQNSTAAKQLIYGGNILEITNCKIINNSVKDSLKSNTLFIFTNTKITNSTFQNNKGGIKATSVTITNTNFTSNIKNNTDFADRYGGAIMTAGTTQIINSTFNKNSIVTNMTKIGLGGALYNTGTLTIINSKFNQNSANKGGSIFNNGIINSTNTNYTNSNATEGGAIFNQNTYNITNATLTQNVAINNGGSIYNAGTLIIKNSRLYKSNATTKYGGAIFNSKTLTLTNNKATLNKASYGAVIYSTGKVILTKNSFYNNTATTNGIIYSKANLTSNYNNFTNNTAKNAAAIFNNNANLTISGNTFTNNTATVYGGALYNTGNLTVRNSTFENSFDKINSSLYNTKTATITNNTFSIALNKAIKNNGGTVTQSNNKIKS